MVSVWIALLSVVLGAIALAFGIVAHLAGVFILGFALMVFAAILGVSGSRPREDDRAHESH